MKIKEIPLHLRPRERAWREGVSSLSDIELLAILLRNGRNGKNALDLSQKILADAEGSVKELREMDLTGLTKKGLGKVQSITLHAALELGTRSRANGKENVSLEKIKEEIFEQLRLLAHEEFWVICLDWRGKSIGPPAKVSRGSRYSVLVEPKEVLSIGVQRKAARIVLVHNHPSNVPDPSPHDELLTKQLLEACAWVEIQLVDHWIVTQENVFSMREGGMLD